MRRLIRHAALLEDGPELAELARRNIGNGMNHAPVDECDSQRCVLLAALIGGNTRDGLARYEALVQTAAMLKDWDRDSADTGNIEGSRHLEAMCMAWVHYAIKNGGWTHAFKLLR